jgi:hypothetical protein
MAPSNAGWTVNKQFQINSENSISSQAEIPEFSVTLLGPSAYETVIDTYKSIYLQSWKKNVTYSFCISCI